MGWYRLDVLGARVAFTDRRGGVSRVPYDTLNLSPYQDDDPDAVARNRALAGRVVDVAPADWVPTRQVHGSRVVVCDAVDAAREPVDADAVVVAVPGRAGVILTADCAPLALVAAGGVAAVHGGWRGLLAGVVGNAVAALVETAEHPRAGWLGPCVRPCCYEFGAHDLGAVVDRFGEGVRGETRAGRPALDVPAVVRAALREAGVDRLSETPVCTACSPDYFSHRREGVTGRQGLLVAWRRP